MKNYKIVLKNAFDNNNRKILVSLYLPIIGIEAFSLYLTLLSDAEFSSMDANLLFDFNHLSALTGMSESKLFDSKRKLEAVNLLQSFYNKKENDYIFYIYAPLTAELFFDTFFLKNTLCSRIGTLEYEKIRYIFREKGININGNYEETSASFNDIFSEEIHYPEFVNDINFNSLKNTKKVAFDINEVEELKKQFVKNDIQVDVNDKKLLSEIFELKEIFNLSLFDLVYCLKNSINYSDRKIIRKQFCAYANNLKNESPLIVSDDSVDFRIVKEKQKLIEFEKYNSDMYVKALTKNAILPPNLMELLRVLREEYMLHDSVINSLIDFSFYKNDEKIVSNYIKKIASTIQSLGIKDAKSSMDYLKIAHQSTAKKIKHQYLKKQGSNKIEWTNEDFKNDLYKNHEITDQNFEDILRKLG